MLGVEFVNCRFVHGSFKEAVFEDCVFFDGETRVGCVLEFCDFAEATFTRCNLGMNQILGSKAYLSSFQECSAAGMVFEAEVRRKISNQMMMGGVKFEGCKLQYAVFAEGDYTESVFEDCDLREVNFSGSNLTRASLKGSALEKVDFQKAVLDGASLVGAGFESLEVGMMASYEGMRVGKERQGAILAAMGIMVVEG